MHVWYFRKPGSRAWHTALGDAPTESERQYGTPQNPARKASCGLPTTWLAIWSVVWHYRDGTPLPLCKRCAKHDEREQWQRDCDDAQTLREE